MQVIDKSSDGLKRSFNVVINAATIEAKISSRLTEVGQQVRLPGFRPGHVPMNLLKQRFGQAVRGEILERTIDESAQAALAQKAVRPAMQPKVELVKSDEGQDLEFSVHFEVLPEISLTDFGKIELIRLKATVSDKEHDEAVEGFLRSRRTTAKVEEARGANKGDGVLADFVGRIDGKAFDGGTAKDALIELGSGDFVPGFEDALIGVKTGETRTFKLNFPDPYLPSPEKAGREAEFEVTVKELQSITVPALDDALAKTFGDTDAAAFKARMRGFVQENFDTASRTRLKRELLDILAADYSFAVPEGLVDVEFDAIWRQMEQVAKDGQLDPDDKDKSQDDLRKEYRTIAERRVRLGLLLSEIGQKNNVNVTADDLKKAVTQEAMRYPGQETAVIEFYQRNQQALESLRAPIFEEKVVDFILGQVKISEKASTIEEINSEPEADSAAPKTKKASK